jgi:hypothetical protein
MSNTNLSAEALAYFIDLAADARNWGGRPLIGGNVKQGMTENGYLTACKKAGLVETYHQDGSMWAAFTDSGVVLAAEHGHDVA